MFVFKYKNIQMCELSHIFLGESTFLSCMFLFPEISKFTVHWHTHTDTDTIMFILTHTCVHTHAHVHAHTFTQIKRPLFAFTNNMRVFSIRKSFGCKYRVYYSIPSTNIFSYRTKVYFHFIYAWHTTMWNHRICWKHT